MLVDTSFALRGPSGTATYVEGLLEGLEADGRIEAVRAERPPPLRGRGTGAGRVAGSMRSAANVAAERHWVDRRLPALAAAARADVLHHPLPAFSRRWPGAQVCTVHDLAFERRPEDFDRAWRSVARIQHRRAAQRADAVIAVSGQTAADVRSRWGVPAHRLVVAPHGPKQIAGDHPAPLAGPYVLYVGDAEPRKNLPVLLAGWRRYREALPADVAAPRQLVVAGAAACDPTAAVAPGVTPLHGLDDAALRATYAHAAALVQPARFEGAGLTVLEAMAAGVPVVAARSPGLAETAGDAALWFAPDDPAGLAARLIELAATPERGARLAQRGRELAASRSWRASARAHADAYALAARMARERTR